MIVGKYCKRFNQLFNLTRKFTVMCGLDVIRKDYKPNWKTLAVFIFINAAILFQFYTNYIEVVVKGNVYNLLKSTSIIGTGLQGYIKLINVINKEKQMRSIYEEIYEIYWTYECKTENYKNCLNNNIALVRKMLTSLLLLVGITTVVLSLVPVIITIYTNQRIELLPFTFPFLDMETDVGFYITSIIHVVAIFIGGFGNFAIDSWLFIFAAHVPLIANILKCKFDDLDNSLNATIKNEEESKALFIDILKWHQKYMEFSSHIRDTFFWVIFVQVATEFFGIIATIVCIFLGIWPPAPAYLIYLFAIFYAYCSLGNVVEVSNDDVTNIIYDSCWYQLTVPEQKMVLVMLRESQQAKGISVGGVAPLSLSTALQVTKTVYTLSMMLMESFQK